MRDRLRYALLIAAALSAVAIFVAFALYEEPGLGLGHFFYVSIILAALATGPAIGASAAAALTLARRRGRARRGRRLCRADVRRERRRRRQDRRSPATSARCRRLRGHVRLGRVSPGRLERAVALPGRRRATVRAPHHSP